MKKILIILLLIPLLVSSQISTPNWSTQGITANSSHWFGTRNNFPLIFKVNNTEIFRATSTGLFTNNRNLFNTIVSINGNPPDANGNINLSGSGGEPLIPLGTTSQYWRGDKTWVDFPTIPTNISSLTNDANYITLNNLSATAPLTYNNGVIASTLLGTPFALSGTNTDANSNKISLIHRDGSIQVNNGFIRANNGTNPFYSASIEPDSNGSKINFGTNLAPSNLMIIGAYNSQNNIDNKTRDLQIFSTGFNGIMYKATTGNVGIGTTTPTEKLDIDGNIRFSGALMPNNTAGTAGQVLVSSGTGQSPVWQTIAGGTAYTAGDGIAISGSNVVSINAWVYYKDTWTTTPTVIATTTTAPTGDVWSYTLNGVTRYRFVPTTYDPTLDAFYSTWNAGTSTLSGLIVTRG